MFRWVCNILIVIIISVLLSACNKDSAGAPAFPGDEAVSSDGIPLKIRYTCTAREYRTLAELKQAKINDRYTYKEYSFLPKEMGFLKSAGFFLKPVKMSELGADEDMRGYVQYDDMVDLYIQYARILRPEEYIEGMEGFNPSYNLVPYYISADYVFHIFRLMLSRMTQQIEEDRFYPLIRDLTSSLLNESIRRYENTSDHGLKNEFKKAAAFFLVPASVMNIEPRKKIDAITTLAEPAIAAMRNENGMVRIEITGTTEDFTQYIPRGYYTKNDTMEKYFKVMMWYGRMYFPADKPVVPLIISSMTTQGENLKRWKSLYDTTSFLVGESEDITIFQVREGALKILGSAAVPGKYPDRAKITRFVQYLKSLKGPRILSASGIKAKKGATTGERVEAQRGFRFIGQRFIPDSYIFTRTTGEVGSDEHPRNIPKGLDVMGILGSHTAETLLKNDFTSIVNLKKEYDKVKNEFSRYQQK
ncbi:MAG TPA: DUF3160 domain-containing protein, partial [Spirochaetota bacterium]|nr:DUF3160 domain-containing protein [Spirochaetota bacterium]